jgi:hypothetical protein
MIGLLHMQIAQQKTAKTMKKNSKKNYFRPTDRDFFRDVKPKAQVFFCPKYIKFMHSNFHLQISSTITSIE